MDKLSEGFEGLRTRSGAFKGAVGALDGILIPMQSPGKLVPNPGSYYSSRKGYFAILVNPQLSPLTSQPQNLNKRTLSLKTKHCTPWPLNPQPSTQVQAIVSSDYKFTWADARMAATSHDSTAFKETDLGQEIEHGRWPPGYFLLGDAAYSCGNLETPNPALSQSEIVCTPQIMNPET